MPISNSTVAQKGAPPGSRSRCSAPAARPAPPARRARRPAPAPAWSAASCATRAARTPGRSPWCVQAALPCRHWCRGSVRALANMSRYTAGVPSHMPGPRECRRGRRVARWPRLRCLQGSAAVSHACSSRACWGHLCRYAYWLCQKQARNAYRG